MGDATRDTIEAFIDRRIAAPKRYCVTTTFADGTSRARDTETLGQAKNYATGERRKIGRDLLSRTTGATVRVVSVEIDRIPD